MPGSWSEVLERIGHLLGSPLEAQEWMREVVVVTYGVASLHDLDRARRALAFQRACSTLFRLQDIEGDLGFAADKRALVAEAFARSWHGVALQGPPWRLSPSEEDRPALEEWRKAASFA